MLRHVTDSSAGIRRRRVGAGFVYVERSGRRIRDAGTLDRIEALAIPPAWTDVWICPDASGHIQATGRDARGRKQYRYHRAWSAARDEAKYERLLEFGLALPRIRRRASKDLKAPALSRRRVLAAVVRLLEKTLIRIGNDEYARSNRSYGLTTLRNHHVKIRGSRLEFDFRAKSGLHQHVSLDDGQLARSVKRCQELPGQKLFEYLDSEGQTQTLGSGDVNAYLHDIAGRDFTAKDFRTWAGTLLAACALGQVARNGPGRSLAARKRHVVAAIDRVACALGNTRSVCRKCYVHPAVIDRYLDAGQMIELPPAPEDAVTSRQLIGNSAAERALLGFLRSLRRRGGRASAGGDVARPGTRAAHVARPDNGSSAPRAAGRPAVGNALATRQVQQGSASCPPPRPGSRRHHSRRSTRNARASRRISRQRRDSRRRPTKLPGS